MKEDLARRREEVARLDAFVVRTLPAGEPAVILGDFNTPPACGELDRLRVGLRWRDTYRAVHRLRPGAAWDPARNPNFREMEPVGPYESLSHRLDRIPTRIDLILTNLPRSRIADSRIVFRPHRGLATSDHHGVLTTFRWQKPRSGSGQRPSTLPILDP